MVIDGVLMYNTNMQNTKLSGIWPLLLNSLNIYEHI